MSDVTLLRKLTLKSTMKFGRHYDITVGNIIDVQGAKGIRYLIWVYYNCENITFFDNVLDILFIPIDCRIKKPSKIKDDNLLHEYFTKCIQKRCEYYNSLSNEEKEKSRGMSRKFAMKNKIRILKNISHSSNKENRKFLLQRKNQGHNIYKKIN